MKPTPTVSLQLLSDHGVQYMIVSRLFGFKAALLGEPAAPPESPPFKEFSAVVDWLVAEVLRRHADSDFAVKYRSIAASDQAS